MQSNEGNGPVDEGALQDEIAEEKLINEEYKMWKKNAPFLYDYMLSSALEWPTLTVQWLPDKRAAPDKDYSIHRLLLGTHTSNNKPNFLRFAEVQIPNPLAPDAADYDEEREEVGGYGGGPGTKKSQPAVEVKLEMTQSIFHPSEVNKARHQPGNPDLVATMCTDGRTLIWDRTKHPLQPNLDEGERPQIELHGHTQEGYGLGWNAHKPHELVTGTADATVKLWDLNAFKRDNRHIDPVRTFTHHTASVNDVAFHPGNLSLVGTVSDDVSLQILDLRADAGERAPLRSGATAHGGEINALAFNPAAEYIVATGSVDRSVGVWDLRNLRVKLHALVAHQDAVNSLEWHPHEEAVLGSSSNDRRVIFWDLSKVGDEQTPEDLEDGPPEIMFMHGGHTNSITDFSWNKNDPWVVCSAADDNMLQVWKVANAIVGKEPEDIPMNELEN